MRGFPRRLQKAPALSPLYKEADVDGDGKIGLGEAIHALQIVSGVKSE